MPCKPLLELKFHESIFSIASHPSEAILAIGLSDGYVFLIQYDPAVLKAITDKKGWKIQVTKEGYTGENINILWKTKRHKGSVRSLTFDAQGEFLYSVGSDGVVKKSIVKGGKVAKKAQLSSKDGKKSAAFTKILKSQTHDLVVLGDEDGDITVIDSNSLQVTNKVKTVHEETVNDIIQQTPNKYPYRFISVGATTLSNFDLRKPEPTSTSDNQEDEILSTSLISVEENDSGVVCGMSDGIITIWSSKNGFMDQLNRVKIAKDETIDCVISSFQNDGSIWCGASNGLIYKVDIKKGKIVETRIHSKLDEVTFLDVDYGFRIVSGGMESVRLWDDEEEEDKEEDENEGWEDVSDSGSDEDDFKGFDEDSDFEALEEAIQEKEALEAQLNAKSKVNKKRDFEEEEEEKADQSEEEPELKLTKKQKRILEKKQKNIAKHEHGIKKFDDL